MAEKILVKGQTMPVTLAELKLEAVEKSTQGCYQFGETKLYKDDILTLVADAHGARENSYSPYSGFRVGAAILARNAKGRQQIFVGTNIENAAYSPTNCAERVAIQSAVAAGYTELVAVAVVGDSPPGDITGPCGTCRQVIFEHGGHHCLVLMVDSTDTITVVNADILLPFAFGPSNLGR